MRLAHFFICLLLIFHLSSTQEIKKDYPFQDYKFTESYNLYWESPTFDLLHPNITRLPFNINIWSHSFFYHLIDLIDITTTELYDAGHYAPLLADEVNSKESKDLLLHIRKTNEHFELAKRNYTHAQALWNNTMRTILNNPNNKEVKLFSNIFFSFSVLAFPIPSFVVFKLYPLVDYALNFGNAYKNTLTNYILAHQHANAAVNIAFSQLKRTLDKLEYAGVGSSEYLGSPKEKYLSLLNEFVSSNSMYLNLQEESVNLERTLNLNSPPSKESLGLLLSIAGAYGGRYLTFEAVGNETPYVEKSRSPPQSNLIEDLLLKNKMARTILTEAENEIGYQYELCLKNIVELESAIRITDTHRLSEFDTRALALRQFLTQSEEESENWLSTSSFVGTLSDRESQVKRLLSLAKDDLQNSRLSLSEKRKNYISSSAEYSSSCIKRATAAKKELALITDEAVNHVAAARRMAEAKITSAEDAINSYSLIDEGDAIKKSIASTLLAQAKSKFSEALAETSFGLKFGLFYNATILAQTATKELLPTKNYSDYLAVSQARLLLEQYGRLINGAKKDGFLDTKSYEQIYSDFQAILNSDNSLDLKLLLVLNNAIKLRIDELSDTVLSYFSPVTNKYNQIKELIPNFKHLLPQEASLFDSLTSKYFKNDLPHILSSTGHYSEIDSEYSKILSKLLEKTPDALQSTLLRNYDLLVYPLDQPCLGEINTESITISLRNPTSLSTTQTTTITLPLQTPLNMKDATSLPKEIIDIAYSPTKKSLALTFSQLSPNSAYTLTFQRAEVAGQILKETKQVDSTDKQARVAKEITFEVERPFTSLCAKIPLPADASTIQSSFNLRSPQITLYSDYTKITLQDVPEGKNTLRISYTLTNPYTIKKENIQVKEERGVSSISYNLVISDIKDTFENVRIIQTEFLNQSVLSFSVSPLSAHDVSEIDFKQAPYVFDYSFKIKSLLPTQQATFKVSYSVDNSSAYAEYLLSLLEPSTFPNNPEFLSLYSEARSYVLSGDYQNAIKKLLALYLRIQKSKYENEALNEQYLLEKNKTEENLLSISALLNKLSLMSSLAEKVGSLETFQSRLVIAKTLLQEADKEYSLGNIQQATLLLKYANQNLSVIEPHALLINAHKNLSLALISLKERAFLLSLNQSQRLYLDSILQNTSSLLQASNSAILAKDISLAINNLKEAEDVLSLIAQFITESKNKNTESIRLLLLNYSSERAAFSSTLQLYLSSYSKSKELKPPFTFPKTPTQLQEDLDSIDKTIAKISAKLETQNIDLQPSEISSLHSAIAQFFFLKNSTTKTLLLLQDLALSSHSLAESSLEKLGQQNASNFELEKKLSELKNKVTQSSEALKNSDWVSSLSLTSGIPKDTSLILATLSPSQETYDPKLVILAIATLGVLVSLLFFILSKKKKPQNKQSKKLERKKYEFEDFFAEKEKK